MDLAVSQRARFQLLNVDQPGMTTQADPISGHVAAEFRGSCGGRGLGSCPALAAEISSLPSNASRRRVDRGTPSRAPFCGVPTVRCRFRDWELLFLFDTRLRCAIASPNGVLFVHVLPILCLPVVTVALVVIDFGIQIDPHLAVAAT